MPKSSASRKSLYSLHPSIAMMVKWVDELKSKTGRSVQEWVALTKKEGPKTEEAAREWLKTKHKHGTNSAWWLAARAFGSSGEEDTPEGYLKSAAQYVETQYSGKKTGMRPLYDELLKLGLAIGPDAKACPCQTIVPLYRNHVFAQIKPTTNTRIDLGFSLGNLKTPKRLINTGGYEKKDRITHRIEITKASEIDAEVKKWLKTAYDLDSK